MKFSKIFYNVAEKQTISLQIHESKQFLFASLIALVLLGSIFVPTLSSYADTGKEKPKKDDPPKNTKNNKDNHENEGKEKDRKDKDKDDHHKHCEHQDDEKYKHHCDE
ncbi:MAG TPA: hypothetical protein VEU72_06780 [Nitrosopumilaceae archaeon]|nr:hypothetical protein [Nitrosopumilaceae archaeon]